MNYYFLLNIAILLHILNSGCTQSNSSNVDQNKKYVLVWGDEFNEGNMLDTSKWNYRVGDGCPQMCGFGNNELQWYSNAKSDNSRIENGHLIIEAHKEDIGTRKYSSARINTRYKADFKYGKVEVKAKLPGGLGVWPAIWMMSTDREYGGWPASGEIDIMEHVGYKPDSIKGTIHTKAFNHMIRTQKGESYYIPDCEDEFHVYGLNWSQESLQFYVDDEVYFVVKNDGNGWEEYPFDKEFYIILNLAVGGNLGGKKGIDDSIFPQRMEIDYVRVFQNTTHK